MNWNKIITESPLPISRKELLKQNSAGLFFREDGDVLLLVSSHILLSLIKEIIAENEAYFLEALQSFSEKRLRSFTVVSAIANQLNQLM